MSLNSEETPLDLHTGVVLNLKAESRSEKSCASFSRTKTPLSLNDRKFFGGKDSDDINGNDESDNENAFSSLSLTMEISNYALLVRSMVEKHKKYPLVSRIKSIEGTNEVEFVIGKSGEVKKLWITTSSGDSVLDVQSLNAVQSAAPFPPPPVDSLKVRVKFAYRR